MTRYPKPFPLDDPALADGDSGWLGVNAKLAPELVPSGYVAAAENAEFREGAIRSRRGVQMPAWGRVFAPLFGAGFFTDPQEVVEYTLLAAGSAVWKVRPGEPPQSVAVPGTIAGTVNFVQAFDTILAFRDGQTPWFWTGQNAFDVVDRSASAAGTQPIPLAAGGAALEDRLFVWSGDFGYLSDIADYTRYSLGARTRFNAGKDDRIVRGYAFTKSALLVFKDKSIFLLSGVSGDLSAMVSETITTRHGLAAYHSVASDGTDALFLAPGGVYRVSEVWENRIAAPPVAVSHDIAPIFERRVNWPAAGGASAAVWEDTYWLALPVDRAAANNAIVAYNLATKSWQGLHVFPSWMRLDRLFTRSWNGRERLFAADFANGCLYLLGEGIEDCVRRPMGTLLEVIADGFTTYCHYAPLAGAPAVAVGDGLYNPAGELATVTHITSVGSAVTVFRVTPGEWPSATLGGLLLAGAPAQIAMDVTLRSYTAAQRGRTRWSVLSLSTSERNPSFTVSLATDGNAEETDLQPAPVTRNRTHALHTPTRWDATNTGNDHGQSGRADYGVVLALVLGSGIVLDREQDFTTRFVANVRGRHARVRVRTTQGHVALRAAQAEGTLIDRALAPTS